MSNITTLFEDPSLSDVTGRIILYPPNNTEDNGPVSMPSTTLEIGGLNQSQRIGPAPVLGGRQSYMGFRQTC